MKSTHNCKFYVSSFSNEFWKADLAVLGNFSVSKARSNTPFHSNINYTTKSVTKETAIMDMQHCWSPKYA